MKISILAFTEIVITALKEIVSPRFFLTERGFQGNFAIALNKILGENNIFQDGTIIEEEYQKRLKLHGFRQRPDLLIHVPNESSHSKNRKENNYVAFAFKLSGNKTKVMKDFEKLNELIEKLDYSLGIFININSLNCFLGEYQGPNKDKLHEFCIKQIMGESNLRYAHFQKEKIVITNI
jgi:hypothetical protein